GNGWRGARLGDDRECAGGAAEIDAQAGPNRGAAGVLRGGADGVRGVLATGRARRGVRGHRAEFDPDESGGSREDGSARCRETGAVLSGGRADAGVCARSGDGGAARCGAGAGGGEAGSAAGAASVRQVVVAAWTAAA